MLLRNEKRQLKKSLPVRGAWIEIIAGTNGVYDSTSLPVRGAWIEISFVYPL